MSAKLLWCANTAMYANHHVDKVFLLFQADTSCAYQCLDLDIQQFTTKQLQSKFERKLCHEVAIQDISVSFLLATNVIIPKYIMLAIVKNIKLAQTDIDINQAPKNYIKVSTTMH